MEDKRAVCAAKDKGPIIRGLETIGKMSEELNIMIDKLNERLVSVLDYENMRKSEIVDKEPKPESHILLVKEIANVQSNLARAMDKIKNIDYNLGF